MRRLYRGGTRGAIGERRWVKNSPQEVANQDTSRGIAPICPARFVCYSGEMATIPPPTVPPREAPITCVQPGGGPVVALERAWGRFRRSLLRRFFPGYVRRMADLRQGSCPNCPHDVIDARDLKLVRNVCGYRFRPEDDRFAWRGRLGLARAGFAEIFLFTLLLLPLIVAGGVLAALHHVAWVALGIVALGALIFIVAFFRDPHRAIPTDPDLLVSPADGVITHVDEVEAPDFPGGKALRVSIFLSVFNVHVNRTPRAGRVTSVRYFPGEFLDARHRECSVRNEQLWIDFVDERLGCPLRVRQVSGAIARRIVCQVGVGEQLSAGERFGMIKFGSRTEVFVPPEVVAEVLVKVGDVTTGGDKALLRLRAPREPEASATEEES
jgi:phosphatidylserine decarboxylase